jgi:E3 ubiquitin-protein ligase RNF115/126
MEYEEEEIENILNYIMNNDSNRYGSPPASKSEIDKLNKYILTKEKLDNYGNENICSVCKEEFQIGNECMDLPCKHYFHKDCLMPWLNQHDSCPICRFELKTEDEDYEKMKRERNNRNNGNIDNNNINEQLRV